jgi:uncharacterized protein (DUF362 family)
MRRKITRRRFLEKSANLGAASIAGGAFLGSIGAGGPDRTLSSGAPDIVVVTGESPFDQTAKAVELLGGIEKFVPRDSRVCLLANVQRNNPGTFTKPDIVRAMITLCKKAGAKEVNCLSWLPLENWKSTGLAEVVEKAGGKLEIFDSKDESRFKPVPVPNGRKLREARILDRFFDHDVFFNLPITKDHAGNKFTGTLKNLMGLNSPKCNRTFHTGNFRDDDIEHLDQSIADLNTVLAPTLNVVDATEFIITNGPFGPGKLHRPNKIVAGIDRVAVDAYCASLWDLKAADIVMIRQAHAHGIGEIDLGKREIREVAL